MRSSPDDASATPERSDPLLASDAELLARLEDDSTAFATFYRRHVDAVVAYASRRCVQPADAADLVAATFVAALDSAASYDPAKGEARPWLIGIAHHQWSL